MPGKVLNSQSREMVASLLHYFTAEKTNGGPLIPFEAVTERVAAALNISSSTVKRIKQSIDRNEPLETPGQSRPRLSLKTKNLDDNIKIEVRNIIYNMYNKKKQITLKTLREELITKHVLNASLTTIRKLLMELGFKYKKDNNRRALMERTDIAIMRINFFRKYMQNRHSDYPRELVFLDETWIFAKGSHTRSWQDSSTKSVRKPEGYDGKRFIVLHAGNEKGFIRDAALVYSTRSKLADYHGDMNSEIFLKWLQEQFIPNLQEPSLIIMDNASYHSVLMEKQPTVSWTKNKIKEWLEENNIPLNNDMFKVELLNLAKKHKKPIRYKVDELLQENGHEVLRLPPYHCQFNAIEMVWADAKDYYNKHIGEDGYGNDKVLTMWERALQKVTPESWKSKIAHTEKIIEEWYNKERILDDDHGNEMIIHIGNVNDDESEDDSD